MKYLYTTKHLVDVLPLREKTFTECGISETNIIQLVLNDVVNSFIEITDEVLLKSLLNMDITYMTESEVNTKVDELRTLINKQKEENKKNSLEYKVELLEKTVNSLKQENADLAFQMLAKEAK